MSKNETRERFELARKRDNQPIGRYTKGAWLLLTVTHSAVIPGDFGDDDTHVWTCDITAATGRSLGIEPIDDHTSVGHINGRDGRQNYVGGKWRIHDTAKIADGSVIIDSTIHSHVQIEASGTGGAVIVGSEIESWCELYDRVTIVDSRIGSWATVLPYTRVVDSVLPARVPLRKHTEVIGVKRDFPDMGVPDGVVIDIPGGMGYMPLEVHTHTTLQGVLAQTPSGA